MVWKTKVLLKVELPTGKLGLTVVKRPPTVGAVRTDSPVVGQVVPGDVILSLTLPGMGDVETKGKDGQAVMDTLVAFANREGRGLTVEKHGIYGVGVPPGSLGVSFVDGTCTVHAVKPTSPLMGATVEGDTLLSVDGQPVTPATIFDVIKAADDGTSERKLVFGGTGCEIMEGVVMMAHRWARTRRSPSARTTLPVARAVAWVEEGPALTNETLRGWVGRWCGGDCRNLKGHLRRFDGNREGLPPISKWNTSRVTDMSRLFMGKSKFNDDISAWDTSSVTTMESMFDGASAFNQPLNDWRVDNVTDMSLMFNGAKSFNQPLADWRVDNVTNMGGMFSCVRHSQDPRTSRRDPRGGGYTVIWGSSFNQPLNDWRVDKVTNMSMMFAHASSFNQPLNDWRVDNATNMHIMFHEAWSFNQRLHAPWYEPRKTICCAIS